MKSALLPILSVAAMVLSSLPASAQMVVSAKSGLVNYVEGNVFLNDQAIEQSITKYPEIKEKAILRADEGRAEVLLTPGVILRLGEKSSIRMITNRLVDTRVELLTGSAVIEAVQTAKDTNVTVVVKSASASVVKAGIYRFDVEPAQIKVYHGEAAAEIDGQSILVGAGRMLLLDGASAAVQKFNNEDTDALDHWSRQRGQLLAMANPSTAKSLMGGGYGGSYGGGYGGGGCTPYWGFNSWYSMYTYVPCTGYFRDPYGYGYWSPVGVYRLYYAPPVNMGGYGGNGLGNNYPSMGTNSG